MKQTAGIAFLGLLVTAMILWMTRETRPGRQPTEEQDTSAVTADRGAPASSKAAPPGSSKPAGALDRLPDGVQPEDVTKLHVLNEILEAKNDNDPRLDRTLRHLSPGAKRLMRDRYRELGAEKRNERGTIVFLLGRNLSTPEDFQFLEDVLKERPCLSLADCERRPPAPTPEQLHGEMGNEVTLAYPQIVALKENENYLLSQGTSPELRALAMRNLELSRTSAIPIVARQAEEILQRLKSRGKDS